MHNALWDPVLFVIDIAEEREVTLGLNSYVFKFDCSFVHEAILNGRPASRAKYDSLLDDVRQFLIVVASEVLRFMELYLRPDERTTVILPVCLR